MSDNIPSIQSINVIGGGLAGTEAAWQIANRGLRVKLFEMRPRKMTPAHTTGKLAEPCAAIRWVQTRSTKRQAC